MYQISAAHRAKLFFGAIPISFGLFHTVHSVWDRHFPHTGFLEELFKITHSTDLITPTEVCTAVTETMQPLNKPLATFTNKAISVQVNKLKQSPFGMAL